MCKEQSSCPHYKEILAGRTPTACSKCFYFNKLNKIELYSKIGLFISIIIFVVMTLHIY